ncbi:mucin-binding protein [Xylocopilactobacillus apicola]|uniref:Mub B2-like domain-containing protein n=1 Tax=Xylocopilactobacillus apicola TaxID=2932184 RepID=A0AAU9DW34_9LACO|nr:BspA family leucine-rich repeat surface protein [Xylocopilactobacillus apicola]BDR59693.1 hypothetical protein XA3_21340 [Xylocopilactobacillus apicola]
MKKKSFIFISSSVLALSMGMMVTAQNVGAETATPASVSERGSQNGEIVKTGVSGTCKWDYIKNDDNNYTLQFHAGNLAEGKIVPEGINFWNCKNLKITFDPGVIAPENCSKMFSYVNVQNASVDFKNFDTSHVTDMSCMFSGSICFLNLDLSSFDTSHVTNMEDMFYKCGSLQSLNLSNFDMTHLQNNSTVFSATCSLNHLIVGPKVDLSKGAPSYGTIFEVPMIGTTVPGTDKVVTSRRWIATSGYKQGTKYTPDDLMSLKGRDQVTVYDWDTTPASANNYESKAVTRTINLHLPDGSVSTDRQTATIKRLINVNSDGTITYGPWSKAQWNQYRPQEIPGYEPDQAVIPALSVDAYCWDTTIDVYYDEVEQTVNINYVYGDTVVGTQKYTGYVGDVITPNYHAPRKYDIVSIPEESITIDGSGNQSVTVKVEPRITQSSESRTAVRTINIHQPNGASRNYQQVAVVKRTIYTNMVTGQKTYGEWGTARWDAFPLPNFVGYRPNQQVQTQEVDFVTQDDIVDVVYLKM